MATKEELYISFPQRIYQTNKSNILMSQADLLEILKRLYNLKVLARQKHDLKKRLYRLSTSLLSGIDTIQNGMPTAKIPKEIQKPNESKSKPKESFSRREDIEEELKLIQEKLKELNS